MLRIFTYLFFLIIFFTFTNANSVESDWSYGVESQVRIISPITKNNNEKEINLGLEYRLDEGWKTYWQSPGGGGFPQEIDWSNSENIESFELEWPTPEIFEILGMKSIGYSNEVIFPIKVILKDQSKSSILALDINYLVCKDICIPGNANLKLIIPQGQGTFTTHSFILEKTISDLPQKKLELSFLEDSKIKAYSNDKLILIEYLAKTKKNFTNPSIFLHTKYGLPVIEPTVKISANSKNLKANFIFDKKLINQKIVDVQIIINEHNQSYIEKKSIRLENRKIIKNNNYLFILLIAFIGGLILNGMPCVLPVLSIKLLSIMHNSENLSSIRKSFIITSLGIVSSFVLLASTLVIARYLGYSVGWGIQFQQPIFLMIIGLILILFALNLFGLFEIAIPDFINSKNFYWLRNNHNTKDFFNGFFATLMATPCSAPFVGTALTFAFTQSSLTFIYIFTVMGLGMASPYMFISIFPQMLKLFPRPGKWMIYLKYFLGLLLVGTTLWVFTLLLNHFNYYFMSAFLSFLLIFLIISKYYKFNKIFLVFAIGIFFTLPNFSFFKSNINKIDINWLDFNLVNIEELIKEDNIIFVDVTAEWCATCQFNKINVLKTSLIKDEFLKYNVIKVRADWTKPNKKIEKFLQNNNKFGIPYNVIFDKNNIDGIELSELLSANEIIEILNNL